MAKIRTQKTTKRSVKPQSKAKAPAKKALKATRESRVGDSEALEAELDQQEDLNFRDVNEKNVDVESSRPQSRNVQMDSRYNQDSEFRRTDEFQNDRTEGAAKSSRRNQNADVNVKGTAAKNIRRISAIEERENDEINWDVTDEDIDNQVGIYAKDKDENNRFDRQRRRDSQIDVNFGRRNANAASLRQSRPHRQATSRSHK